MGTPSTTGALKTTIESMSIGDYISCEYVATSGAAGTFSNLGSATKSEIATSGSATPNGTFYFVKAAKGLLIADRVIQTSINWGTINGANYIEGKFLDTLIPSMTSNTTPSGIASESAFYDPNPSSQYRAWRALTGSLDITSGFNYCWHLPSGVTSGWIAYEFESYKVITNYSIVPQNAFPDRAPKNWTFEGWNGSSWVVLHTATNQTSWGDRQVRAFSFSNSTSYKKYRVNISSGNGNYIGIGSLKMWNNVHKYRSLTGGVAFATSTGSPSTSVLTNGAFPVINEWDSYIVNFPSNLIAAGKTANDVFNCLSTGTLCQETTINGIVNADGGSSATASLPRTTRGNFGWTNNSSRGISGFWWNGTGSSATLLGFRPVIEFDDY